VFSFLPTNSANTLPGSKSRVLNGQVLVLNQSYEPISICSPQKAIILLFLQKAEMIANNHLTIRTVSDTYPFPTVIRLKRYIKFPYKKVELSRKNIFRRDAHTCQYCGSTKELTIDHILPKSRGGADTWENLVAACKSCNNIKGDKTPQEANMSLLSKPSKPHHIIYLKQFTTNLDNTWKPFLFF
jgi:5-methylcytosine-specific restriction endonuclease McrA